VRLPSRPRSDRLPVLDHAKTPHLIIMTEHLHLSLVLAAVYATTALAVSPNDVSGSTDSDRIEAAIASAVSSGANEVVIPKTNQRTGEDIWLIDQAILLPSNMRLVLDDCLVRLAPGTQDNIIRTALLSGWVRDQLHADRRCLPCCI